MFKRFIGKALDIIISILFAFLTFVFIPIVIHAIIISNGFTIEEKIKLIIILCLLETIAILSGICFISILREERKIRRLENK